MNKKFFKICSLVIYIIYTLLVVFLVYNLSQTESFSTIDESSYSEILTPKIWDVLFAAMPFLVLLLFGFLLYGYLIFRRRRPVIFSSMFAASILNLYPGMQFTSFQLIAFAIFIFGLAMAFLEFRRFTDNNSSENNS